MSRAKRRYQELLGRFANTPEYKAYNLISDVIDGICEQMHVDGISRAELARRLGVTPQYVTNFLNGTENTTVLQLVRFAGVLGLRLQMGVASTHRAVIEWVPATPDRASFTGFDSDALDDVLAKGVGSADDRGEVAA